MAGLGAAVAGDIDVVPLFCGDKTEARGVVSDEVVKG